MKKSEIIKRGTTAIGKTLSVQEQMDILKTRFKISPTLAETHEVIANGNGGYTLMKRETPIRFLDGGEGHITILGLQRSYAERVGINARTRRGKYNDEARLTLTDCVSVEPHETVTFARVCE